MLFIFFPQPRKILWMFSIIFISLFFYVHSIDVKTTTEEIYEESGIFYKTNRFGDIYPLWEDIPEKNLTEKLLSFIEIFQEKQTPIIIEIPHDKSPLLKAIIQSNFTLHYADQTKSSWIIRNHSSIPYPFTAISGAHIMVIRGDKVLVVEERTRKGILGLPAGGAEPGEFVRETACRELWEETGLIAQPENLKLIALINRKNANQQGASLYGHCFITDSVKGNLNIDPKEIIQAFWVPIVNLAEATEVHNLNVNPYIRALAKHVLNGCNESYSLKLLDIRQSPVLFNSSDVMNVEFFQQNLIN